MRRTAAVAFATIVFVSLGSSGGGPSPTTPVAQQPAATTTTTTPRATTSSRQASAQIRSSGDHVRPGDSLPDSVAARCVDSGGDHLGRGGVLCQAERMESLVDDHDFGETSVTDPGSLEPAPADPDHLPSLRGKRQAFVPETLVLSRTVAELDEADVARSAQTEIIQLPIERSPALVREARQHCSARCLASLCAAPESAQRTDPAVNTSPM
jgi:hypothetical protein